MRAQTQLTFSIGTCARVAKFERDIVTAACLCSGGCTTTHKDGHWAEDGATHADLFFGAIATECCFELVVTCETAKLEIAYRTIKAAIIASAATHGVDADWVHVIEQPVLGRHFSISDCL